MSGCLEWILGMIIGIVLAIGCLLALAFIATYISFWAVGIAVLVIIFCIVVIWYFLAKE